MIDIREQIEVPDGLCPFTFVNLHKLIGLVDEQITSAIKIVFIISLIQTFKATVFQVGILCTILPYKDQLHIHILPYMYI